MFVKQNIEGAKCTVIDSDEFAADPETALQFFCQTIGVEFDADMLVWKTEKRLDTNWAGWSPFFDRV
jgi:hypothetical protein